MRSWRNAGQWRPLDDPPLRKLTSRLSLSSGNHPGTCTTTTHRRNKNKIVILLNREIFILFKGNACSSSMFCIVCLKVLVFYQTVWVQKKKNSCTFAFNVIMFSFATVFSICVHVCLLWASGHSIFDIHKLPPINLVFGGFVKIYNFYVICIW